MITITAYGCPGNNILVPVIPAGVNHYSLYGGLLLLNYHALNIDVNPHAGAHMMAT